LSPQRTAVAVLATVFLFNLLGRGSGDTYAVFLLPLEREFAGPRVATIYGTIFSANAIGAAFGSLLGGVLHDLTGGYRTGFALSLCAVAMAVAPFWTVPALRNFR